MKAIAISIFLMGLMIADACTRNESNLNGVKLRSILFCIFIVMLLYFLVFEK